MRRDSAVGIATGYGLNGRGVGVRVQVVTRISPLHLVQAGSGAHPASYPMGTEGSFPGGNGYRSGKLTTHLQLLPSQEYVGLYTHSIICLHGVVLN
jgi:hypothetical protein